MMERIEEIQSSADKLEMMVRALVDDRASARSEVARLKQELDDRELAYLQLDEEHQKMQKEFEEERARMTREKEEAERQLSEVADRIRSLLPILEPDRSSSESTES